MLGCTNARRVRVNKARLYNNNDDVKVVGLHKVVTIRGRNYYVIYCNFKNNTDEELSNIRFNIKITDKNNKVVEKGAFEIDKIEPGKTILCDYFVKITDTTDIDKVESITFTGFQHGGEQKTIPSTKEITFYLQI